MEDVREEIEETNRKLHPRTSPPTYNNGHSNGRQNGFRGGSSNRGGQRRNFPGQSNGGSFEQSEFKLLFKRLTILSNVCLRLSFN